MMNEKMHTGILQVLKGPIGNRIFSKAHVQNCEGNGRRLMFLLDRDYFVEGQSIEDEAERNLLAMTLWESAFAVDLFMEKWDEYLYTLSKL